VQEKQALLFLMRLLRDCYEACKEANVLFVADEVQSGLGPYRKNAGV